MKRITGCAKSNVGLVRTNNEDNYLLGHCLNEDSSLQSIAHINKIIDSWISVAVFDGMGGLECGEVASNIASHVFQAEFMCNMHVSRHDINRIVTDAFVKANQAVIDEKKQPCGTTGSVVVTDGDAFKVFHVGDCRVYLYRKNKLYRLTKDQTLAQLKMDIGIYSSWQEVPKKENHQLTEYIGMEEYGGQIKPYESEWINLCDDDEIILCSDGIYDMCKDEGIERIISSENEPEPAADEIMQLAMKNGGNDNATIIIVKMQNQ